ncbi:hypothetical protein GOBAR_AA21729 [Gossypium barbadense]|uniref:Uncharacterized protein n=1 Tax=Gossypium barbadense TaxID=3634 RepID=A0A2P5X6G7_GOSBA|nr:hypothetical protein GOBAR_AA21729 [Gossypium barbadense]
MGNARVPSFQTVHFVVFEIGHIGVHSHVARPCKSSFTFPTPVYAGASPCYFERLDHGQWAWSCRALLLNSQFQPRFLDMGVSHARVVLIDLPTAMSNGHGDLSQPLFKENFALFSHDRVSSRGVSTS